MYNSLDLLRTTGTSHYVVIETSFPLRQLRSSKQSLDSRKTDIYPTVSKAMEVPWLFPLREHSPHSTKMLRPNRSPDTPLASKSHTSRRTRITVRRFHTPCQYCKVDSLSLDRIVTVEARSMPGRSPRKKGRSHRQGNEVVPRRLYKYRLLRLSYSYRYL